ncbi:MAG: hypothetical protein JNK04_23325 [Myxococcales bacterium]|nr:hypothetical protein [Myxococcales bacterium]
MRHLLTALALSALLLACSSSAKKKDATESSSEPEATTSAAPAKKNANAPAPFESTDDLLAGVPADVHFCGGMPGLSALRTAAGAALTPEIYEEAIKGLAKEVSLPAGELKQVVEGFDGAVVFGRRKGTSVTVGALLHFAKPDLVPPLLEAANIKKSGDRYAVDKGDVHVVIELLEKRGVAIVAQDAALADEIKATLEGTKPSFETSPLREKHDKNALWVVADTSALIPDQPDFAAAGSRVAVVAGLDGKSSKLELKQLGIKVPRLGAVLAPNDHAFAGRMPPGVNSAFLLSTKRAAGKTLRDVLTEVARATGDDLVAKVNEGLKPAGVSVDDLERALGDEVAFGFILGKGAVAGPDLMKSGAFVALIETRDDAVAGRLIDQASKATGGASPAGKLKADLGNGMAARAEVQKGATVVAVGAPAFVNQAIDDVAAGKQGLAGSPLFQNARKRVSASNLSLFLDPESLGQLKSLGVMPGGSTFDLDFDLFLLDSSAGLDMRVTGNGSIALVGVMSALGVYGVRRYMERARAESPP